MWPATMVLGSNDAVHAAVFAAHWLVNVAVLRHINGAKQAAHVTNANAKVKASAGRAAMKMFAAHYALIVVQLVAFCALDRAVIANTLWTNAHAYTWCVAPAD